MNGPVVIALLLLVPGTFAFLRWDAHRNRPQIADRLPREQPNTTAWERANADGTYADMARHAERFQIAPEVAESIRRAVQKEVSREKQIADLEALWLRPARDPRGIK